MNNYKMTTAVVLWAISTVAYAAAVYLECAVHKDMTERYVSYGDCVEARHRHNRDYHRGAAVATCRNRLR